MIKVFCGDDSFESYHKGKEEFEKLVASTGFPGKILDVDDMNSVDSFLNEFETIGFFSESYVIFAKRLLNNKKIAEFLLENFDRLNNYEIVIWQDSKLDGRKELTKFLKKKKVVFEFTLPKEWQFKPWIQNLCKELGIKLTDSQINLIVENLGVEKWLVKNELDKVAQYQKLNSGKMLSDQELDSILGFDAKGNIWKFIEFLFGKNRVKALGEFEKLTRFENSSQLLIAMIAREIGILSQIKYAEEKGIALSSLGLHPFVLQKSKSSAAKFSFEYLKALYKRLLGLDLSIKQGKIDEKVGLTLYLMNI